MVITLSGAVLFTSGKSDLLPAAQVKLNDVAKALIEQDPDSKMVVEGHTDSVGSDALNKRLSLDRANSVRASILARQVPPDRADVLLACTFVVRGLRQQRVVARGLSGRPGSRGHGHRRAVRTQRVAARIFQKKCSV